MMFTKSVPFEFQRRPRSFQYTALFKATELRMFLCYTCPVLLLRLFSRHLFAYGHFMLLVAAMRILLSPSQPQDSIEFARHCLKGFVEYAPEIYGKTIHVYNVHSLIHLADDYHTFGSLDLVSSFPFESYMYFLKSYVKRPGQELEQVVKRIHEEQNSKNADVHICRPIENSDETVQFRGQHFDGPLGKYGDRTDIIQFSELIYLGRFFRLNSSNDVVYWNGKYCKICNILQVGPQIVSLVKSYKTIANVFSYPCKSSDLGICFVEKKLSCNLINVHVTEVVKCWVTEWNDKYNYVVKLLHEHK